MTRLFLLLIVAAALCACDGGGVYARKDGQWMYGKERVVAAGHEDIRQINDRFARSGQRVWYRIWPIPEADPNSFRALDENYAADTARAWYLATYPDSQDYFTTRRLRMTVLDEARPASLRVLGQRYAADEARVYYEGVQVRDADPESFHPLTEGFARDRVRGYHAFVHPVPFSDGPSFEVVSKSYAKDRTRVFYLHRGADGAPLAERAPGADPATFQALPYDYAADAARIYYGTRVLAGEPKSFQVLDFGYAKTPDVVYHRGQPVIGADPASFEVLAEVTDEATARDKTWFYKDGEAVKAQK